MRRAILFLFCLLPLRLAAAPSTAMDVAPTLIRLEPRVPGLFYVTNHGAAPVTVEVRPMDWRQQDGRDLLSPSATLVASPPQVTIAPGVRQSVRLLATQADAAPRAWRVLVSELPDPATDGGSVKVLLQFSVPVFAGDGGAPLLSWSARHDAGGVVLEAANHGAGAVRLTGAALGGAVLEDGPLYLLPGVRRTFHLPAAASWRVTGVDALSGKRIDADASPLP